MAYDATVFGVMIASPSDCDTERNVVRAVIHDWNASHARFRRIILEARDWESYSFPTMGTRPQAAINESVLDHADLLIATFWTRLGTPTGVAASGTAEEIDRHVSAGRHAMIYVSRVPVQEGSVDPAQYLALQAAVARYREQGLIEYYESIEEFRGKLTRQLAQVVNQRLGSRFTLDEAAAVEEDMTAAKREAVELFLLGDKARELLQEATRDARGNILVLRHLGGTKFISNRREFGKETDARQVAAWTGAIDELESAGYINDRGFKREVFGVTDLGYRAAERLGLSS